MIEMNTQPIVAKFLSDQFQSSGKGIEQVAAETGIHPTIVKMIFSGTNPLPVNRIVVMANALGVAPAHLCEMVVKEYLPGLWETIDDCVGIGAIKTSNN